MAVRMTGAGLFIDDQPFPLYSGAVQYWRLEPEVWEAVLDRICELGFSCIEVYLPWGPHEPERGRYDFSGKLDAGRFLDLAHERELKVIARPGPHTNAEVTGFGYPDWVLADQDCLARSPEGSPVFIPAPPRMFPMPSYAGDALYDHCAGYFDRVCEVLAPRQHPDGPVIAVQPDNEMSFFFRTSAFDVDYSDASRTEYRRFLRKRYKRISRCNRAHGTARKTFDQVEPPTRFDARSLVELPPYLDWCAYREAHLIQGVGRVASMLRERGVDRVPTTHNIPLGSIRSPFDLPGMEREIDLVGIDMYYRRTDHRDIKARCVSLCGASRFPYSPEFASGGYHAWPPIDLTDQTFTTLAAMMHGVRGFNFYMLVDRERWYGAPIRRDGSVDPDRWEFYPRILQLARQLEGTRRTADCLLATTRLYGRLESLHNVLDPLSPMAMAGLGLSATDWVEARDLGCGLPEAATLARLHEGLFDALGLARVAFDVGEPDRPEGNLSRYRLVILPTVGLLERKDAERLMEFARAGGTVVMGPKLPEVDERGSPLRRLAQVLSDPNDQVFGNLGQAFDWGSGQVVFLPNLLSLLEKADLDGLVHLVANLAAWAGCMHLPDPEEGSLETSVHMAEDSKVIWLANPTGESRTARLDLKSAARLKDLWLEEEFPGAGAYPIPMPPWAIRPLEVEHK